MEYRNLGQTGLKVSPLCLGAMTFGEADENSFMHKVSCSESDAHQIMNEAVERGINFIDTADVYGQDGLSERVIGNWFTHQNRRAEVVLASKVRFRMFPGPNGTGASRRRIIEACEQSLRRLKTDWIDLYQIHMQDDETPEEETLRALDDLVRQGKVLHTGCSNYAAYRLVDSLSLSREHNLARYSTIQMQYSMLVRDIEREHVPACRKFHVGILPWSPLAAGFLTGKYRRQDAGEARSRLAATDRWKNRYASIDTERNWQIIDAVRAVAAQLDTTPAAVSLAWLMNKPCVTSVIFGVRSVEQLKGNLEAARVVLSDEHVESLDTASALEFGYPYEFIRGVNGRW